jgi:hypothetical protein
MPQSFFCFSSLFNKRERARAFERVNAEIAHDICDHSFKDIRENFLLLSQSSTLCSPKAFKFMRKRERERLKKATLARLCKLSMNAKNIKIKEEYEK